MTRQVVLDTETTGLETSAGHRIIEIGCVELVNRRPTRRTFHRYVNPERAVDAGALEVHGIDDEFLADQPRFSDIVDDFLDFVRGAELVIHNADFDIGFINYELRRLSEGGSGGNGGGGNGGVSGSNRGGAGTREIRECCGVLDTLALARRMHPGQRNSLDALAKRYSVDNSKRELHGALLDAQILAEVFLAMTGGQVSLSLDGQSELAAAEAALQVTVARDGLVLAVPRASAAEEEAHAAFLARIRAKSGGSVLWDRISAAIAATSPSRDPIDTSSVGAATISPGTGSSSTAPGAVRSGASATAAAGAPDGRGGAAAEAPLLSPLPA
jgi:DNA polymerase III subunit epsilon